MRVDKIDAGKRGEYFRMTVDSLPELADIMAEGTDARRSLDGLNLRKSWAGATTDKAVSLAREGWTSELAPTLTLAEQAITKVEREHTVATFTRRIGTVGKRADLGRYAAGQPECMIALVPTSVPKVGRVITLCAGVAVSAAVSADSMRKRGANIAALALALDKLGYATELWADCSTDVQSGDKKGITARVLVKGAHDVTDPAAIMFAYAHPAFMRVLSIGMLQHGADNLGGHDYLGWSHGTPCNPVEDLPEGTIYTPALLSGENVPNADAFLLDALRTLGLILD